jgi:enamine deaminase RidA (YjgF/YER057c/UK114 family)
MGQLARFPSGAPWEPVAAYSRVVKAGNFVAVSGTTSIDERGLVVGKGQMYVQARQTLLNIQRALERIGLSMRDVIRTRIFVTDISRFTEAARAHHDFFADCPPASTMVEIKRLVHPDMMIEIEADAYAGPEAAAAPAAVPAGRRKTSSKSSVRKKPAPRSSKTQRRRRK